ncbi:hypothetical protein HMPREF0322_02560 [Desulfitobacterium hafniense DP7]|uniref:Uncharacterized protein n=1 Tax=Desulfitobacterium hafniense DP7 TaxID=537010 RepID=G9XNL7_DESHA|nr:hypothetical protein HMPREF0322_02560 [Desulfitobacterium hafniense DP7]
MSVKSGLGSTCCQVAWRVRPYRVKPVGCFRVCGCETLPD